MECWFLQELRIRTCGIDPGRVLAFNILSMPLIDSPVRNASHASSLGQQGCSISSWPRGGVLDWNPQGCRFDCPKASLCDLGQTPKCLCSCGHLHPAQVSGEVLAPLCLDLVFSSCSATMTWISVLRRVHWILCFSLQQILNFLWVHLFTSTEWFLIKFAA